ncbi:hypothetical protein AVDCRST_MAG92-4155 [uncultured Coleofasciculus sp.]|uniref:Uncharacterized protein n=1 Tax=uncultured Coleofasciculus sp. TaxID=1267456 RepID=A0A6J4JVV5_9CYAN|nr:hypothetical protein AVDCRST_MAG92-4155 [uncultured Coleofasciculus sp.]
MRDFRRCTRESVGASLALPYIQTNSLLDKTSLKALSVPRS